MVLVTVGLVVVQEMCARLGSWTGQGLGALLREQFSLRTTAFALALLVIANTALVVSEFAGIAAAMQLLHVSRYLSVPIAALAVWALVVLGSYRYAEKVFLALSLVFIAYPVSAVLAHPNWSAAAHQSVVPHLLASKDFLLLAVALIGTTITPYMQFYIASAVADRGLGPADYRNTRLDTVSGAIFADLVSMFIIIATAAAVTVRAPLDDAAQAATALTPVAGRFAEQLFAIGLLGASALAAAVVPLSTSYAVGEAIGTESSVSRNFGEAKLFLGLFTVQILVGAVLGAQPRQPDPAAGQRPDPQRDHHPDPARFHPHVGQPTQFARRGRQRPRVPRGRDRDRGPGCGHGTRRGGHRSPRLVRPGLNPPVMDRWFGEPLGRVELPTVAIEARCSVQ